MKFKALLLCALIIMPLATTHADEKTTVSVDTPFTLDRQMLFCELFLGMNFNVMKQRMESYNTTLEESYDKVRCHDGVRDLLKYRMLNYSGRADIAAFILYYKRDLNRENELPVIFNRMDIRPKWPCGTLIDYIEYYASMDDLNTNGREEYARIITLLRKYGGKAARELDPASFPDPASIGGCFENLF